MINATSIPISNAVKSSSSKETSGSSKTASSIGTETSNKSKEDSFSSMLGKTINKSKESSNNNASSTSKQETVSAETVVNTQDKTVDNSSIIQSLLGMLQADVVMANIVPTEDTANTGQVLVEAVIESTGKTNDSLTGIMNPLIETEGSLPQETLQVVKPPEQSNQFMPVVENVNQENLGEIPTESINVDSEITKNTLVSNNVNQVETKNANTNTILSNVITNTVYNQTKTTGSVPTTVNQEISSTLVNSNSADATVAGQETAADVVASKTVASDSTVLSDTIDATVKATKTDVQTTENNAVFDVKSQKVTSKSEFQQNNSSDGEEQKQGNFNSSTKESNDSTKLISDASLYAVRTTGFVKISDAASKLNTSLPVTAQLNNNIMANLQAGKSEFTMQLFPANLGKVSVRMISENGMLTVELIADNPRTQSMLLSNANEIKELVQSSTTMTTTVNASTQNENLQQNYTEQQTKENQQQHQEQQDEQKEQENDEAVDFSAMLEFMKQSRIAYQA